jgi:hypothetical protein
MDKTTQNLLIKAAIYGAGAYIVYSYILKPFITGVSKIGQGAATAGAAIGVPIGNALAWWLVKPPMGVNGSIIVQPSGAVLNPVNYPITWRGDDPDTQMATIQYAGQTYVLGPHDAQGNWPAMLASSLVM